jgi:GNAT superfamily N-acetyltransferase
MPQVRPAVTDSDIQRCWRILRQLRPDLTADALLPAVRRMELHGFHLACAEDEQGAVRAVIGYRITEMLRTGPMLEIDDLITDADARSAGYGRALFEWALVEARKAGCSVVELDSGVQRHAAHRFYFRHRMHILGYHFSLACGDTADSR